MKKFVKKLPIGVQNFPKMINDGYLYVDKTETIYRLLSAGSYYFLARPRRFGKSLLISTLHEIFSGNQALFAGLWIYDQIEWQSHPIIWLDFSEIGAREVGLTSAINQALDEIATSYGLTLQATTNALKLRELIHRLAAQEGSVVILVDEYDKPIIDHLEDITQAEINRDILKNLYSVIKASDPYIRFFMITGVSKFSHVSIFSDLNNLNDITFHPKYSQLLGYTEAELQTNFAPWLDSLASEYADIYPDIQKTVRLWYDGYSWDGRQFVYNPFSILSLCDSLRFEDYWFQTGTPTFLMKLIRNKQYTIFDLENRRVKFTFFNKHDLSNLEINTLLFQAGYLTIKQFDLQRQVITLDFPNKEVADSFAVHLLAEFNEKSHEQTGSLLYQMGDCLETGQVARFIDLMQVMFANIAYPNIDHREKYYHTIFYLSLKLLGYTIESEVMTHDGRIDAVLETADYLYIIEFKLGDADTALQQIKSKQYHRKYATTNKQIILLGIGFDSNNKNIAEFKEERV